MTRLTRLPRLTGRSGLTRLTRLTGLTELTGSIRLTQLTRLTGSTRLTRLTGLPRLTGLTKLTGLSGLSRREPLWARLPVTGLLPGRRQRRPSERLPRRRERRGRLRTTRTRLLAHPDGRLPHSNPRQPRRSEPRRARTRPRRLGELRLTGPTRRHPGLRREPTELLAASRLLLQHAELDHQDHHAERPDPQPERRLHRLGPHQQSELDGREVQQRRTQPEERENPA